MRERSSTSDCECVRCARQRASSTARLIEPRGGHRRPRRGGPTSCRARGTRWWRWCQRQVRGSAAPWVAARAACETGCVRALHVLSVILAQTMQRGGRSPRRSPSPRRALPPSHDVAPATPAPAARPVAKAVSSVSMIASHYCRPLRPPRRLLRPPPQLRPLLFPSLASSIASSAPCGARSCSDSSLVRGPSRRPA